jgi:cbb3-type cytochrome oxidase subunit 3
MKQQVLSHWDLPWLPVSALIIFLVCFIAYVIWTFRKANKKRYERAASLPLEEGEKGRDK